MWTSFMNDTYSWNPMLLSCRFVVRVDKVLLLLIVPETDRLEELHGRKYRGRPRRLVGPDADLEAARFLGQERRSLWVVFRGSCRFIV